MKADARILDFVFGKIGEEPSDTKLVEWADACETASISLLGAVEDKRIRDDTLAKRDDRLANCIRRIHAAIDAIENGKAKAALMN